MDFPLIMNHKNNLDAKLKHAVMRAGRAVDTRLLKHDRLPEQNWNTIPQVFIVSTGRTGTLFFARYYNLFPGLRSLHEPRPDFKELAIAYAQGHVPFKTAVREIERQRRPHYRELRRRGISLYIESNNRFFSLLNPLRAAFPESKIVYIVRDGRDYVRSGLSRNWYTPGDTEPRLRADMFPDDPWSDQWESMDRFQKIAWRWRKKDGFIQKDFEHLDNAVKVTFEDIFLDPDKKGLYRINRFIGIPDKDTRRYLKRMGGRKVNTNTQKPIPKWTMWDAEMTRKFDEIAGEHWRLHYGNGDW